MESEERVQIRIPRQDLDWLRDTASARRTTVASVLRGLVAKAIEEHRHEARPWEGRP